MSVVSLAVRTTGAAVGSAAWEIRTDANTRARLLELGLFLNAATASVYGLGTPAAIGITPTSPVDFLAEDGTPAGAGKLQSALAWGTAPTAPTTFFRRWSGQAVIGAGVIWTFPKGLLIPVSAGFVLWNITANAVVDAYAVLDRE